MTEKQPSLDPSKQARLALLARSYMPKDCPEAVITPLRPYPRLQIHAVVLFNETNQYITTAKMTCRTPKEKNNVCNECELKEGAKVTLQHALN